MNARSAVPRSLEPKMNEGRVVRNGEDVRGVGIWL